MGLTAGPVPPRVEAPAKAGLLALIDHAVERGWSTRRACALLGLDPDRAASWRGRARAGRLQDQAPGGGALHGLLDVERAAIIELFEAWGGIDRSHRKLAARGSRLELVHVAASTVHRVLAAEGLVLQGVPAREPAIRAPWPDWIEWKPQRIWCYDFTHFMRAKRVAVAVLDVVSRRWLSTLVSAEETSTQIEAAFLAALDEEGLADRIDHLLLARLRSGELTTADLAEFDGPELDGVPVLIAMSDPTTGLSQKHLRVFNAETHLHINHVGPDPQALASSFESARIQNSQNGSSSYMSGQPRPSACAQRPTKLQSRPECHVGNLVAGFRRGIADHEWVYCPVHGKG